MTPESPILLSVVTPSRNQARFLRRNIESVLEQGVPGVEHIVMDGASTDGSVEILRAYPHLIWESQPDSGQSQALNRAIARARGEWIVWINSDDYLLPGALLKFLDFAAAHPAAQFVYSNCTFVDEAERVVGRRRASYSRERRTLEYWWRAGGAGFAQPGSIFRKALWEEFGPFDESLHYAMDYDFWLKMCGRVEFLYLDDDLATYRLHGEAKTSEGWRPFAEERLRVMRRYWGARGLGARLKFAVLAQAMMGTQMLAEGVHAWRRGERARAVRYWAEGVARNPLCFLSPAHWRFLLRRSRRGD